MSRRTVTNWGNYPVIEADVIETRSLDTIRQTVEDHEHLIARGNGRCYGDSSLGQNIFSTLKLNRFLSFDQENGVIECESGVLLSDVLNIIIPKGFFLPVTPGTKFITVGGAIAADVHGKNHHCEGTFSNHVECFELLDSDGTIFRCSRNENSELFWQTCGGMGLTGIILKAKFRLKPIETSFIHQISHKARGIDSVMELFESSTESTYSVAWIDCLAKGKELGRSILMLGEHAMLNQLPSRFSANPLQPAPAKALDLPFFLPAFSLNHLTVKAFNFAYYNKQLSTQSESVIHFDPYFYPLDGIHNWNRGYGRRGFIQYQCVLPLSESRDGLVEILSKIAKSGQGSPLAVLKLFGKPDPNAIMSFPMEGYTLALDFKVNDEVFALLDQLDRVVLDRGGRLYLAKDARMSSETFHSSYRQKVSSGRFSSAQSERLKF